MTGLHGLVAAAVVLGAPSLLLAQNAPAPTTQVVRADIAGTAAWVSVNKSDVTNYDDWRTQAGAGLGVGWYWTDHLVTRIEGSATTRTTFYSPVEVAFPGSPPVYVTTRRTFSTRRLAVLQHYQFRRNEWVHPFVGAGVDMVWERVRTEDDPVYAFDPVTRQSRLVRGSLDHGARTGLAARGVLAAGVKAYMTRNVFALTELRVSIGARRTDDVQWRFGLGVDFLGLKRSGS